MWSDTPKSFAVAAVTCAHFSFRLKISAQLFTWDVNYDLLVLTRAVFRGSYFTSLAGTFTPLSTEDGYFVKQDVGSVGSTFVVEFNLVEGGLQDLQRLLMCSLLQCIPASFILLLTCSSRLLFLNF